MGRLFAGTPWDRPPTCDRCGRPESECACPPPTVEPVRRPPGSQTAHLRLEKRPKGKVATVVANLDPDEPELAALASRLKALCGTGGTVKDGRIELQGDHREAVATALQGLGYKLRRDQPNSII